MKAILCARMVLMGEKYKSFGMLGKKHSEETRRKIALSSTGRTHKMSDEGKRRISELRKGKPSWNKGIKYSAISGNKHWNWQGGITPLSLAVRASSAYKRWRTSVFERDNFQCVLGGKEHGNDLVADHIKSFSKHSELRLDINNGRTLCRECHKKTENYCGKARLC